VRWRGGTVADPRALDLSLAITLVVARGDSVRVGIRRAVAVAIALAFTVALRGGVGGAERPDRLDALPSRAAAR